LLCLTTSNPSILLFTYPFSINAQQKCTFSLRLLLMSELFAFRLLPCPRRMSVLTAISSHPWSHVVIGMWHKYPNSKCTHVVSIDTLDRTVDPETGIIRTERVLGCKQKTPAWIVKVRFSTPLHRNQAYVLPRYPAHAALRRLRRRFCP